MKFSFHRARAIVLVAGLLVLHAHARALQEQGGEPQGAEGESESKDEAEKGEEHWFAVIGGDVYTGTGETLRGATVLARNGKISAIGFDIDLPPDTKVLDVNGLRVYPGLVAISSQGLMGSATSDFEDTTDPFNSRMILGLAAGITTTGISNSAVKLKRFALKGLVLQDKIFSTLTWSNRNPSGKRGLREKFAAAAEYLRKYRDWQEKVKKDKELKEPPKKGVDTSVLSIIQGEMTAKFNASNRDELLGIARLAQEFGFRPVIEGCQEGWTIADELGRAGAMAIVTPRDRRTKDELLAREGGTSIENAAILHRSGVPVAVIPATEGIDLGGIVGRDIMHLPIEADFAVRGGLSEQAALEAITIVPARMLRVSHRVGSLEVGKDCDLIVTDGDILHYQTFVQYTVIDGKQVYDKEKELFFAHIRPRPVAEMPAKKLDKGESETKPPEKDAEPTKDSADEKKDEHKDEKKDGAKDEANDGERNDGERNESGDQNSVAAGNES